MRSIPIALAADYAEDATTLTALVKVICKDGTRLAFTALDAALTYNDGTETLAYSPSNGFTPSRLQSSADFSVDNAEYSGVVSETGITESQIRGGLFDFAKIIAYEVNYLALGNGHRLLCKGTAGETVFSENGWRTEFRSLTQQTKQPISTPYSLTCRAKFGSQPIGTPGAAVTERYPCQYDAESEWVSGTITGIGAEADRIFTDSALLQAADYFVPGAVEILSGPNDGVVMDVEAFAAGVVTLTFPLPYDLTNGTTFRIRRDCDKTKASCKDLFNNLPNMRAEHLTPVADAGSIMVPGAYVEQA